MKKKKKSKILWHCPFKQAYNCRKFLERVDIRYLYCLQKVTLSLATGIKPGGACNTIAKKAKFTLSLEFFITNNFSCVSCVQCRGWGTDLVPPYMSQIYSQQLNLHEQAAKRESLSALALAISTPR
jgi:hypothetical protein